MAITITEYPSFKTRLMNKEIDLDSDTIKVALLDNSASYNSAHDDFSDVSGDEISGTNGYTTGGQALANKSIANDSGVGKWDADDLVWTASGGDITTYNAVIYDDTHGTDSLIAFIDLDGAQTATDGNDLTFQFDATGIVRLD